MKLGTELQKEKKIGTVLKIKRNWTVCLLKLKLGAFVIKEEIWTYLQFNKNK